MVRVWHHPWKPLPKPGVHLYQPSQFPAAPQGELVDTVDKDDLVSTSDEECAISNVEYVASYNWVDDQPAKIIVPGLPPRWTPVDTPVRLSRDAGNYYRDPNAAFYPLHPMEAAAVATMEMNTNPVEVDIFACSSTLGNLLRFIHFPGSTPFRILGEMVGNTLHLVRRENSPRDTIPDVQGFGHTFPEAFTSWKYEVKDSKSHQRIIKYDFAGLHLLVRFESDGFIESGVAGKNDRSETDQGVDADISAMLASQHLQTSSAEEAKVAEPIAMKTGGREVDQSQLIEIKTRSTMHEAGEVLDGQLHRIWVTQIKQFVLAQHYRGAFQEVKIMDVKAKVAVWEKQNQPSLQKLAVLLRRLIEYARDSEDSSFEIVCPTTGILEIRKKLPDAGALLSPHTRPKYESWIGGKRSKSKPGRVHFEDCSVDEHSGEEWNDDCSEADSSDLDKDLTACDSECGYCGKCPY